MLRGQHNLCHYTLTRSLFFMVAFCVHARECFALSLLLVTFVSHGKETTNAVGYLSNAVQGNVKGVKEIPYF
jgi:hypothetical protein